MAETKVALSAGAVCIKYSLFVFNFLFMLSGLALIGLGSYAIGSTLAFLTSTTLAVGVIVVGCFITIICFLGCCGAVKESTWMLKLFAFFVLVFILAEISLGITAYVKRDSIAGFVENSWIELYETDKDAIVDIQTAFECCGWSNASYYAVPPYNENDNQTCVEVYGFEDGCQEIIVQTAEDSLLYIGITAIVLGVLQIAGFIFACVLAAKIPTNKEKEEALLNEARALNREQNQQNYNDPNVI